MRALESSLRMRRLSGRTWLSSFVDRRPRQRAGQLPSCITQGSSSRRRRRGRTGWSAGPPGPCGRAHTSDPGPRRHQSGPARSPWWRPEPGVAAPSLPVRRPRHAGCATCCSLARSPWAEPNCSNFLRKCPRNRTWKSEFCKDNKMINGFRSD